jgi:hypothetical protein
MISGVSKVIVAVDDQQRAKAFLGRAGRVRDERDDSYGDGR